ncbi:elongin-B-like [Suncus etruscus]|uniref:elongin-B-like n=1 Tax=Suncus etruscus TaxID=109475 RepID=UPI00210FB0D1|nr:elongin-B-like [Suncus etruscus]
MDMFLMTRRHKITIFTNSTGSSIIFELKCIIGSILKWPPDEQHLYKENQLLDNGKMLGECGFTSQIVQPQAPAMVGLAFQADKASGVLHIKPLSSSPKLPNVMKPQDSGSKTNEQAVQ